MKNNHQKIFIVFIILFVLVSSVSVSFAKNSNGKILPEIVQTGDEKFDKTFREGRELIDKEDWKQAAEKFKSIVCDCPEKKYVDAAFYWLAFTYKKQKMYAEMNQTLNRLQTNFPNSSWADDARVMRMSQPALIATASPNVNSIIVNQIFGQGMSASSPEKIPLDREEEIKLAAFRSLLSADANRAIELTGDILKSDSKASESLKIQVIRLLPAPVEYSYDYDYKYNYSYPSNYKSDASGQNNTIATVKTTNGGTSASPSTKVNNLTLKIRETLIKGYQNNSSVNLKKEIVRALGRLHDIESINYIFPLYNSASDKELKKAILLTFIKGTVKASADFRKITLNRFLEIVKTEKDNELREYAFDRLDEVYSWLKPEQKTEIDKVLLQIYDTFDEEEVKTSIIELLGDSKQDEAVKKLMDIAKNDKSDKLRIRAINALRSSKNPEVTKFLEDLIK